MDEKYLAYLLKYSSSSELWIVSYDNLLKILFCPFRVLVLTNVGTLTKGQIVWVQNVKITQELKTVYIVKEQAYYYYHFEIIVKN
ncbi:MAG: hypothetical protein ACYCZ2_11540 [Lutibacter sp.]